MTLLLAYIWQRKFLTEITGFSWSTDIVQDPGSEDGMLTRTPPWSTMAGGRVSHLVFDSEIELESRSRTVFAASFPKAPIKKSFAEKIF